MAHRRHVIHMRSNDYVSYFSTRSVNAGVANRKGMAGYSNREFFSVGKNLEIEIGQYQCTMGRYV